MFPAVMLRSKIFWFFIDCSLCVTSLGKSELISGTSCLLSEIGLALRVSISSWLCSIEGGCIASTVLEDGMSSGLEISDIVSRLTYCDTILTCLTTESMACGFNASGFLFGGILTADCPAMFFRVVWYSSLIFLKSIIWASSSSMRVFFWSNYIIRPTSRSFMSFLT